MGEELTGTQIAAALHGIATNHGYVLSERFRAALQALDIYEQEYDRIHAEWEKVRQVLDSVGICGDPAPTLIQGIPTSSVSCDLPANHVGWHGADNPPGPYGVVSRMSWSIAPESASPTIVRHPPA